jgi:hypothetical protein
MVKKPEHKYAPLWKKSMVDGFSLFQIENFLEEIMEHGDMYGYEYGDESEYYLEYKELFDELALGAEEMLSALRDSDLRDNWDDMVVVLIGPAHKLLGFDESREDYFTMMNRYDEEFAADVSEKRITRLTKRDLIRCFQKVMTTLVLFLDIKAAHDSLCAIVDELDNRAAMMKSGSSTPQRSWIE